MQMNFTLSSSYLVAALLICSACNVDVKVKVQRKDPGNQSFDQVQFTLPQKWEAVTVKDSTSRAFRAKCGEEISFCDNIVMTLVPLDKSEFNNSLCSTYEEGLGEVLEKFKLISCKDTVINAATMKLVDYSFSARGVNLRSTTAFMVKKEKVIKMNFASIDDSEQYNHKRNDLFIRMLSSVSDK
ncbi:hypothetical protein [Hymenobacter metallicola]|uniref:Uncharacterized protein n=1 Tax=Hymenobacter metallicola TaxID=2563114 RepID=A0A4Z0QHL5_9BACT|nr:hypothetical protein [Hymenobacter metallicola]TGE29195.1 hypothetical protein E5K02_07010 [Hymenobacter metallicola]